MLRASLLAPLVLLALGCSGEDTKTVTPKPTPRAWDKRATPSDVALGSVRGHVQARGILHSHSPYSHDACDGEGLDESGVPRPDCVANLRRGMCDAAEDFVFLTDHAAHMADADFPSLLFIQPGDEPVLGADGAPIGNYVACGDGRRVLVAAGNENSLMSVGLERHLPGDPEARLAAYQGEDAATVAAMHEAGALVIVPHTESRDPAWLASLPVDGIEVYNVHAAIDPDIRRDFFGLDAFAAGVSILPFTRQDEDGPQPDLALLGFFEDLPVYGERWDALLATRHVTGVAGTDVHENTFPGVLRDGERGDSYRRLMRWFSNIALVDGPITPSSVKAALAAGRSYVAFEILGAPSGFDFHAEAGGSVIEMGGQAPEGATIVAHAPKVHDLDPAVEPPTVSMRLLHIDASGTRIVAEGGAIRLENASPGAYRVEVRIHPTHLRPHVGDSGEGYIRERLWVLANPIRIL
ncbi:hypothetical protein [Polyangium spumosum]|uniref:DUF3604 domain-containing protein n=1 Tax=Polyangium spumosum TaxID=889282 RepID=A0A6N7PVQ2_9BACT|nr:hypothetical protein [Polyangium spumosum]MRG92891.1 hypothetical protein [Polyangium spumosum]